MKKNIIIVITALLVGLAGVLSTLDSSGKDVESNILSYVVNPHRQPVKFYWKNANNKNYANFRNLKLALEKELLELVFAANGGMYDDSFSPVGLYIENGVTYKPLDTTEKGRGNFYLQPNGVFFLTKDNNPAISKTEKFNDKGNVKFATQSGPMLLIDGKIHPKFKKNSHNKQIRNGVGILANGDILFAMSKDKINFYSFALFFKQRGCKYALYLDGYVSKTYLPSKNWKQLDGKFGVIIGVTNK